jgi:hypothetical protein
MESCTHGWEYNERLYSLTNAFVKLTVHQISIIQASHPMSQGISPIVRRPHTNRQTVLTNRTRRIEALQIELQHIPHIQRIALVREELHAAHRQLSSLNLRLRLV